MADHVPDPGKHRTLSYALKMPRRSSAGVREDATAKGLRRWRSRPRSPSVCRLPVPSSSTRSKPPRRTGKDRAVALGAGERFRAAAAAW
jgi:hypothetical protein